MATRKCPYCAEKIQFEAKICHFCKRHIPPAEQSERKTSTGTRALAVVFSLIGFGMMIQICGTIMDSPSGSAPTQQPRLGVTGTTVVLVTENPVARVPVVTTFAVWGAIGEAAHDQYQLSQIDAIGGTYTVAPLTKALVLENKIFDEVSKVRMLDGKHKNRTGWVSHAWIRK